MSCLFSTLNRFISRSIGFICLILLASSVCAEEPSVTAFLSSADAAVGEQVQLQIQVKGDRNVGAPAPLSVDGLEIQSSGQTQSFEMRNFDVTSSVTFN